MLFVCIAYQPTNSIIYAAMEKSLRHAYFFFKGSIRAVLFGALVVVQQVKPLLVTLPVPAAC